MVDFQTDFQFILGILDAQGSIPIIKQEMIFFHFIGCAHVQPHPYSTQLSNFSLSSRNFQFTPHFLVPKTILLVEFRNPLFRLLRSLHHTENHSLKLISALLLLLHPLTPCSEASQLAFRFPHLMRIASVGISSP